MNKQAPKSTTTLAEEYLLKQKSHLHLLFFNPITGKMDEPNKNIWDY